VTQRQLRLLVLAPGPPTSAAAHGGAVVVASLVRHLADVHRIALVYLRAEGEPPLDDELRRRCDLVVEVPRPGLGRWRARRRRITGLMRRQPSWVAEWSGVNVSGVLRRVAGEWKPDLAHVHFPVMGQFLDALPGVPRILIVYEPATDRARESVGGSGIRRALATADFVAWRHFERATVAACDAVVVLTERDRMAMSALGAATPLHVIPLATTIPEQPLDPLGSEHGIVLFFGNFGHAPNIEAAKTLIRVWPGVRRSSPHAKLELVGPDPPPDIRTDERNGIHVTGRVPDLAPYLDHASVVAAPLSEGGGMRVKVLETLAAGKALVASPLAVEGLDGAEEAFVVAAGDEALAEALARLLRDREARKTLARRARAFAEENLGWSRRIADYVRLDEAIAARRSATAEDDHQNVASETA
jgi:glycosyltransferase involved in cell wall biosynthesis